MGRKIDPKLHAAIEQDLLRADIKRHSKSFKPGPAVQAIADKHGVSYRTVDRIRKRSLLDSTNKKHEPQRRAKVEGFLAELDARLDKRAKKNLANNRARQRRLISSGI